MEQDPAFAYGNPGILPDNRGMKQKEITPGAFIDFDQDGCFFKNERVVRIGRGLEPGSLRFAITESGRKVALIDILSFIPAK